MRRCRELAAGEKIRPGKNELEKNGRQLGWIMVRPVPQFYDAVQCIYCITRHVPGRPAAWISTAESTNIWASFMKRILRRAHDDRGGQGVIDCFT
jgi:hypothetical protein